MNTDPNLPSYFSGDSSIRGGIEAIDRSGGSSPLDLVVADARGGPLNNEAAYQRLTGLHRALERHRDVGAVLSIAPLMAETKRPGIHSCFPGNGASMSWTSQRTNASAAPF